MANKVILAGNLGKDPVIRHTENTTIASFPMATRGYKDDTDWHGIVCFGKTAEIVEKYIKKGSKVYVEGRLKTRSYEDNQGVKKWVTEVIANEVEFLDSKGDNAGVVTAEEEIDDLPF